MSEALFFKNTIIEDTIIHIFENGMFLFVMYLYRLAVRHT